MSKKNSNPIPAHVAVICDGNRRWAKSHGWDVIKGHQYALDVIFEPLADKAAEMGIGFLTFWVFSTENWNRDKREVEALMNMFRKVFDEQVARFNEKNIRVNHIGDLDGLPEDIQQKVRDGVEKTKNNTGLTLTFAMNYGGHDELRRAIQKIAAEVAAGKVLPENIDEKFISKHLDTAGMPEPDLIIRTSGEQRLSGFMSWQSNYAEFSFPEFHFPELTPDKFEGVVKEYGDRKRRFGAG